VHIFHFLPGFQFLAVNEVARAARSVDDVDFVEPIALIQTVPDQGPKRCQADSSGDKQQVLSLHLVNREAIAIRAAEPDNIAFIALMQLGGNLSGAFHTALDVSFARWGRGDAKGCLAFPEHRVKPELPGPELKLLVLLRIAEAQAKGLDDFGEQSFETFGRTGPGALRKPINVRLGPAGKLYVADTLRNQIVVFDTDGKYITEYGTGKEFRPADIIVSEEELFVLDIASHSIHVYDLQTHQRKRSFGQRGKGFGEFNYPTNMVMDSQKFIHICDSMNLRVQKIDQNGKASFLFGKPGRTPGHFSRPRGIAVDRDGIIYVADARMGIVQLFDPEGKALMYLGKTGTGEGQLYLPAQVVISYDIAEPFRKYIAPNFEAEYLVFVTNQLGPNKVSIFAFGKGPVSATTQPATQPKSATTQRATQPK